MQHALRLKRGEFPYWFAALAGLCGYLGFRIATDEVYRPMFATISRGIGITILVTALGFILACILGLGLAMAQGSRFQALRHAARFWVELIRGIPIIVLLAYVAFVAIPGLILAYGIVAGPAISAGLLPVIENRDIDLFHRAIAALAIGYGAFIAEIFRAGIDAVDKGQIEAAKALGLSRMQTFRLIVFPQAVRIILPPLGNDLVSMVKDSALVSAIGVGDIAFMGKVAASNSFRFFEAYNIVAFLYLIMTIGLSLGVRGMERRLARGEEAR